MYVCLDSVCAVCMDTINNDALFCLFYYYILSVHDLYHNKMQLWNKLQSQHSLEFRYSLSDISTLSLELLWKSFFQKYKSLHSYKVPEFQYNINTVGEYNLQRNFETIYLHNIAKFFFQDNYILSTIPFLHGCCVNVTLRMTSSQRG